MKDIFKILPKYFNKEATEEESQVLEEWKAENPSDFEWLQLTCKHCDQITFTKFDASKALQKVKQQTEKADKGKTAKRVNLFRQFAAAAAIATLIIAGASLWWSHRTISLYSGHQMQMVELPDESRISLNKNAEIRYKANFLNNKERRISFKGEGYFDIVNISNKPFVIEVGNAEVSVLGTSFSIKQIGQNLSVVVDSGKVALKSTNLNLSEVLSEGMRGEIKEDEILVEKNTGLSHSSWKTGVFRFTDAPILKALNELNDFYEDKIRVEKNFQSDCLFNGTFNNTPLEEVIATMERICELKVIRKEDYFILTER